VATSDNFLSVTGTVPERPEFSKPNGVSMAVFALEVRHEWTGRAGQGCERAVLVPCWATGYAANSIRRYWHPGCHLRVVGQLDQHDGKIGVRVAGLGYLSPRTVMEACSVTTA